MSTTNPSLSFPDYVTFMESIAVLALPMSASELHGILTGYLCAGALTEGEAYLRTLVTNKKKDMAMRACTLALFSLYVVTQQQLARADFDLKLLLPHDDEPLSVRVEAFREWCAGFIQGMTSAGVGEEQLQEDDSREALQHLVAFSELDYQAFQADEADERALMEVTEYTRVVVLSLYEDLLSGYLKDEPSSATH